MLSAAFLEAVKASIGVDIIDTSPEILESHGQDWTRVYKPDPAAVAFPRSTQEVSTLLRLSRESTFLQAEPATIISIQTLYRDQSGVTETLALIIA